jgi:hypothetical protein
MRNPKVIQTMLEPKQWLSMTISKLPCPAHG